MIPEALGYSADARLLIVNADETLRGLEPVVTELICHPAIPTEEVKAALPTWTLPASP